VEVLNSGHEATLNRLDATFEEMKLAVGGRTSLNKLLAYITEIGEAGMKEEETQYAE